MAPHLPEQIESLDNLHSWDACQLVVSENYLQIVKLLLQILQKLKFSEVTSNVNVVEVELIQHVLQNEGLSLIVFDDQDFVDVLSILNSFEWLEQNILVERLAEEVVIVQFLSFEAIKFGVVSSNNQNWSLLHFIFLFKFPNLLSGFNSIHARHEEVHQNSVILVILQHKQVDSLLPIVRSLYKTPKLFQ